MLYVTETSKDFETAAKKMWRRPLKRDKYGLHTHDLQKTLKEKGLDFPSRVRISGKA